MRMNRNSWMSAALVAFAVVLWASSIAYAGYKNSDTRQNQQLVAAAEEEVADWQYLVSAPGSDSQWVVPGYTIDDHFALVATDYYRVGSDEVHRGGQLVVSVYIVEQRGLHADNFAEATHER